MVQQFAEGVASKGRQRGVGQEIGVESVGEIECMQALSVLVH